MKMYTIDKMSVLLAAASLIPLPVAHAQNNAVSPYEAAASYSAYNSNLLMSYDGQTERYTELKSYNDSVYVSDHPLGPFTYAPYSPFSFKPTGFIGEAGQTPRRWGRRICGAVWNCPR